MDKEHFASVSKKLRQLKLDQMFQTVKAHPTCIDLADDREFLTWYFNPFQAYPRLATPPAPSAQSTIFTRLVCSFEFETEFSTKEQQAFIERCLPVIDLQQQFADGSYVHHVRPILRFLLAQPNKHHQINVTTLIGGTSLLEQYLTDWDMVERLLEHEHLQVDQGSLCYLLFHGSESEFRTLIMNSKCSQKTILDLVEYLLTKASNYPPVAANLKLLFQRTPLSYSQLEQLLTNPPGLFTTGQIEQILQGNIDQIDLDLVLGWIEATAEITPPSTYINLILSLDWSHSDLKQMLLLAQMYQNYQLTEHIKSHPNYRTWVQQLRLMFSG